jgi:hypothetical protein
VLSDILHIEEFKNTTNLATIVANLATLRASQPHDHPAYSRRFRGVNGLADDMVEYTRSNEKEIRRSMQHLAGAISKRRLIGTAVACSTWIEFMLMESADKADEFWLPVLTGESLSRSDPRMQFRNRLLDAVTLLPEERASRKRDTHRLLLKGNMAKMRYAITAWNYWITQTPAAAIQVRKGRVTKSDIPVILGSDATKKQIKDELGVNGQ